MQAIILISSCVAIFLIRYGQKHRVDRAAMIGCMIGLVGQPFWLASTALAGQWGMFLVSCWFTLQYLDGCCGFGWVSRLEARLAASLPRLSFLREGCGRG